MPILRSLIFLGLVLAVLAGPVATAWADDMPEIPHKIQPQPDLLIGGQPEPEHLKQAHRAGVGTVINLRSEDRFDDGKPIALLRDPEMLYIQIPVAEAEDLNRDSVAAFDRALTAQGDDALLVHCASGNRVGAMYALRAAWIQGADQEEALAVGREHGLAGLEETVREKLSETQAGD